MSTQEQIKSGGVRKFCFLFVCLFVCQTVSVSLTVYMFFVCDFISIKISFRILISNKEILTDNIFLG